MAENHTAQFSHCDQFSKLVLIRSHLLGYLFEGQVVPEELLESTRGYGNVTH